jgi:signal transduction histidine kinase
VADLSHRLRTPITALRLDVDGVADAEQRERLAGDVDALTRAVDSLIAEARRPVRVGVGASSDLSVVATERVAFWGVLADEQQRRYEISVDPGVDVAVPEPDLAAVLDALLGNVFAHTPDGTAFRVRVTGAPPPGGGVLVVEDEGPGLPDDDVVDRGQSRAGSSGLGLDIIRNTAEASGGGLELAPFAPGGGARLTVRFGPPAP